MFVYVLHVCFQLDHVSPDPRAASALPPRGAQCHPRPTPPPRPAPPHNPLSIHNHRNLHFTIFNFIYFSLIDFYFHLIRFLFFCFVLRVIYSTKVVDPTSKKIKLSSPHFQMGTVQIEDTNLFLLKTRIKFFNFFVSNSFYFLFYLTFCFLHCLCYCVLLSLF